MSGAIPGGVAGPIDSLDYALAFVRRRVSAILHDHAGPALCAAGLHLELLAQAGTAEERAGHAANLRAALEQSLETVRALMTENDPRLLERGGFDGAMTALARVLPLDWEEPAGGAAVPPGPARLCFRVARDCAAACAAAEAQARPAIRRDGATVRILVPGGAAPALEPWLPGWRHWAAAEGLAIALAEQDGGLAITLSPGTAE